MMSVCNLVQNFGLPGEICRKFAVDWSQDNKISVCTCKAIYILSSYCSPVENEFPSPLHKQVIGAPEKSMQLQPIFMPPNPYSFVDTPEDEYNIHHILMDHTLNPLPPERAEVFRGYRCARWSPKGAAKAGRCILATLTMDHRLVLYEEIRQEWVCICDLTEVLKTESEEVKKASQLAERIHKNGFSKGKLRSLPRTMDSKNRLRRKQGNEPYSEDEEDSEPDASEIYNYKIMMNRTFRLAPVEITWTGMFGSPASSLNENGFEYCYLIVAMKSGHIQFWKISANDGRMISLSHEWDSGLGMLTSICWQQTSPTAGFLMCGTLKGIFAFLPVSLSGDLEAHVVVKEMCKVWDEEDLISVDQIAVLKIALKKYVIVAAKQHALVGCEIVLTDSSIIIRNVGHSFGLHKLPITAMVPGIRKIHVISKSGEVLNLLFDLSGMSVLDAAMPQFRLLIATMEGLFAEIKISLKDDEIKFQHEKVNIDLDLKNMMVQGLAVSSNGILCSLILSTITYFDHLEKKEALQFVQFVTKPFEEIYIKLRSVMKPAFSFLPTSSSSISRHTDFLECIRINLVCGTPPLPDWMMAFLDSTPAKTLEGASDLELYTVRDWASVCCKLSAYAYNKHRNLSIFLTKHLHDAPDEVVNVLFLLHCHLTALASKEKGDLESKLCAVEALILRNYISKVFSSCQDKIDLLTPAQGQSLLLMADWLLKEFSMSVESLYSALGWDVPVDADSLPARETCRICKCAVQMESIKMGQCSKGHRFARCCQSLLLCDIVPYYSCAACKSVALQNVWNFGHTCTLCGMTMS